MFSGLTGTGLPPAVSVQSTIMSSSSLRRALPVLTSRARFLPLPCREAEAFSISSWSPAVKTPRTMICSWASQPHFLRKAAAALGSSSLGMTMLGRLSNAPIDGPHFLLLMMVMMVVVGRMDGRQAGSYLQVGHLWAVCLLLLLLVVLWAVCLLLVVWVLLWAVCLLPQELQAIGFLLLPVSVSVCFPGCRSLPDLPELHQIGEQHQDRAQHHADTQVAAEVALRVDDIAQAVLGHRGLSLSHPFQRVGQRTF